LITRQNVWPAGFAKSGVRRVACIRTDAGSDVEVNRLRMKNDAEMRDTLLSAPL
jgi:hypothetical protein